jgi:hypothetical protein
MSDPVEVIARLGPLTGKELIRETGMDTFLAWRLCAASEQTVSRIVGQRYLRLDKKVNGYARLSPSIMREFLNYTIIGLEKDRAKIEEMAGQIEAEIAAISRRKITLARETIQRLVENHPEYETIAAGACFIIAGDVVFGMAHAEPRPESSTGELVRGSDLDIIVISEKLSGQLIASLDEVIYREKYNLLMNPASKEELDYIIKDLKTVKEQLRFNNFKAMVASKILNEGQYLYGSYELFARIGQLLKQFGIDEKLALLEEKAKVDRSLAEYELLSVSDPDDFDELMPLFYTTEEKEEIF